MSPCVAWQLQVVIVQAQAQRRDKGQQGPGGLGLRTNEVSEPKSAKHSLKYAPVAGFLCGYFLQKK